MYYQHECTDTKNENDPMVATAVSSMAWEPVAVVYIVEIVMNRHTYPLEVKARARTCFAKLRKRFATGDNAANEATLEKLSKLVWKH